MKQHTRKRRKLIIIILILILILAVFAIDSNTRIVTTEYQVYSDRLPQAFDGFRIVQLSDLHGREFGEDNSKLLDDVRAANPDIIAITGDFFDEYTEDGYAEITVSSLCEIAPVYYVSGNHEWWQNPRDTFDKIEEAGANVLRNEYVTLEQDGETIVFAGVDDPNGPYDMITKDAFVAKIKETTDDYILMLSHRNTDFELWTDLDVDLVLSGHAHGGIIRIPGIGGILIHREDIGSGHIAGMFEEGNTTMIVSRGLGNSVIPRMFNNPEIVVAVLRTK